MPQRRVPWPPARRSGRRRPLCLPEFAGLRDDLSSGRWAERNRDLVALDRAELGLRLLVA
ncbi:hypothetical protein GTY67_12750 [Streptomyces sp. SID8374]|uniref:hypothetical protein n=1 Tax=Streptomyces sp. SID8374 TaxID=2690354 RepID=UPI0013C5D19C|nr:hypothetical protein [Streptomyces sp. SID8374]MYX14265.1 hypothetical protein [Streptomyces sp. SID8374]